jgi:hypothetical protein
MHVVGVFSSVAQAISSNFSPSVYSDVDGSDVDVGAMQYAPALYNEGLQGEGDARFRDGVGGGVDRGFILNANHLKPIIQIYVNDFITNTTNITTHTHLRGGMTQKINIES